MMHPNILKNIVMIVSKLLLAIRYFLLIVLIDWLSYNIKNIFLYSIIVIDYIQTYSIKSIFTNTIVEL